ncbi:hypothetical protein [Dictyobacter kobayashii]|uniref:Uncharacterized protein n=1 Tax=Dictyobacter kobayashii TaxID=2014872 RepID=A0A402ABU7_9CHLR|nr:hypothetical protein [Dictyobacter kobayashii]GCE16561.1 hypothetical protein KDK_03610 [Dictyobacter kobayashii]
MLNIARQFYYILAEQFDADPFLIFTLRGRNKEQVIEALRSERAAAQPGDQTSSEVVQPVVATLKLEDHIATSGKRVLQSILRLVNRTASGR